MNAAVIDQDGVVVNIVVIDDDSDYDPGDSLTLVRLNDDQMARVGDRYVDGDFVSPTQPGDPSDPDTPADPDPVDPPRTIEELAADLADLRHRFATLCADLGVDYPEGP